MRVIEPALVSIEVDLGVLSFFVAISLRRVGTASSDALPLTADRELLPGAGEDLADVDLVVVCLPILVVHPPVAIVQELIVELLSELELIVPSLILVTETTSPLAGASTPRVADIEKLKLV